MRNITMVASRQQSQQEVHMSKNVLIVAAHPDDEVLGCFATVKKLIERGWSA